MQLITEADFKDFYEKHSSVGAARAALKKLNRVLYGELKPFLDYLENKLK